MNIYKLSAAYRDVLRRVDEADGALDQSLEVDLDAVEDGMQSKVDAVAKMHAEMSAEANAIQAEEHRLRTRRWSLERRISQLHSLLEACLRRLGWRRLRTSTHTVSLQKNPPKVVLDVDPAEVPDDYIEYERRVVTKSIREALKRGPLDFAHSEQGESVRIK